MVLETQMANCFELATLLVSFLIGCGYNAYVVQGYATEDVCNNDLRKVKLDLPMTSVCVIAFNLKYDFVLNWNCITVVKNRKRIRIRGFRRSRRHLCRGTYE